MSKNVYKCIVTGVEKYIAPSIAKKKIHKFGNEAEFRKHYVSPTAAKLLRAGQTVDQIRQDQGVTDLPAIPPIVLTKQKLIRKRKGIRAEQQAEELSRTRYLNSKEYKDKMRKLKLQRENMTFQDWVESYTGIGRHRGGTCLRPDIFLSHNNRACDGCQFYEFCLCYQKRLSHEKKKKRIR